MTAPTEALLLRAGANANRRGATVLFDVEAARAVLAASHGFPTPIAFDDGARVADAERVDAGRGVLHVRDGALYLTAIHWGDAASKRIEARELRYLVPIARLDADGRAQRVDRVVLAAQSPYLRAASLFEPSAFASFTASPTSHATESFMFQSNNPLAMLGGTTLESLTQAEKDVCKSMGMPLATYLAAKKARLAAMSAAAEAPLSEFLGVMPRGGMVIALSEEQIAEARLTPAEHARIQCPAEGTVRPVLPIVRAVG